MVHRRPRWALAAVLSVILLVGSFNVWRSHSSIGWGRQLFLHEGLAKVLTVEDGVTLVVIALDGPAQKYNGKFRIRLLGIERPQSENIEQRDRLMRADEMTRQFVAQCEGQVIRLVFDQHRFDETETPLAYVFYGDECLNEKLLAAGVVRLHQPAGLPSKWMRNLMQAARPQFAPPANLSSNSRISHAVE